MLVLAAVLPRCALRLLGVCAGGRPRACNPTHVHLCAVEMAVAVKGSGPQAHTDTRLLPWSTLLLLWPIPVQVYLSTLEMSKSVTNSLLHRFDLGDTAAVGAASFVGGAMASLSSQLIVVPIDVVAQRLMIMGGGPPPGGDPSARAAAAAEAAARHHTSGLALARSIVAAEGVRGLYRGFGASLAMFVPNSAIW